MTDRLNPVAKIGDLIPILLVSLTPVSDPLLAAAGMIVGGPGI